MKKHALSIAVLLMCVICGTHDCNAQLTGSLGIHDPSTIIKDGDRYYVYSTGNGVSSKYSDNLTHWQSGPRVFSTAPAWTQQEVPANNGSFWAPDILKFGDRYRLYYSISSFGSQDSAIGLATNMTLDPSRPDYEWVDEGLVIDSEVPSSFNAIDPSVFFDETTNQMWMTFGSFWSGIFVTELNSATGKPLSTSPTSINIARNPVNPPNAIEAPYLYEHEGYYYLFVNWGNCCQGVNSTYQIRMGRSMSPTGPFLTRGRGGASMVTGNGDLFLGTEGSFIGPGHMSIFSEDGIDYFGYHYYSGTANGTSRYNIEQLAWTMDGWPIPASDLIPGDFNGDKVVDQADLGVWNTYYGIKADGRDFLDWQRNYGATLDTNSALVGVPEPCGLSLFLWSSVVLMNRHQCHSYRLVKS